MIPVRFEAASANTLRLPPAAAWSAVSRALRLLDERRWWLVPLTGLGLAVGALDTALLYLLARLALSLSATDHGIRAGGGRLPVVDLGLPEALVLGAVLLLGVTALSYVVARLTATLMVWVLGRQRQRLLDAYLSSSWAYRIAHGEGRLQALMGGYSNRTQSLVYMALTVATAGSAMLVIALAALVLTPVPALVSIAGLAVVVWLMRPVRSRLGGASASMADAVMTVLSRTAQTARLSAEIAAFDVGGPLAASVGRDIDRCTASTGRVRFLTHLSPALFYSAALALVLVVLASSMVLPSAGSASIGLAVLLLVRSLGYGRQLQGALHTGIEAVPYLEKLATEVRALERHAEASGTVRIERVDRVTVEEVDFEYVPGCPVLSDVGFEIEAGDMIGLMGPTGGGKSTLVHVLVGLLRPTGGRVLADGIDLRTIQRRSWARAMAFVPQDNQLILGTVADNIRFYRPGCDAKDVEAAARSAHLHERILDLPKGYDTLIGPGARGLSGGERQRLCIARALLGEPSLLVLDEPTSALDEHSERLVQSSLTELRGETTIVVVAHRVGLLRRCSRVLEVEGGTVRERQVSDLPGRASTSSRLRR